MIGEQDEFGSLCRHLRKAQMRLPRKKDLDRKRQEILRFTNKEFTDVRIALREPAIHHFI